MTILSPKKWRKKNILAKLMSDVEVDPAPSGAANAILATNVQFTPMEGTDLKRNLDRQYLGQQPSVFVGEYCSIQFDVEATGSGTSGTAAKYGPLMVACGRAETAIATALTDVANKRAVGTPTGVWTGVAATAYAGTIHRRVTLECTIAGASGTASVSVTAPARLGQAAINVASAVMTNGSAFTLIQSATITPTITTDLAVGDKWTIDLYPARVRYSLVSEDESAVMLYFNIAGTRHKMMRCRGSVSLVLEPNSYAKWRFRFLGLCVAADTSALPDGDFSGYQTPDALKPSTIADIILHGYAGVAKSVTIDQANQVNYRPYLNQEDIVISDRAPTGSLSLMWAGLSAFDPFAIARAKTTGRLELMFGSGPGKIIRVEAPKVELAKPRYVDDQGDTLIEMEINPLPDAGNDDFTIFTM